MVKSEKEVSDEILYNSFLRHRQRPQTVKHFSLADHYALINICEHSRNLPEYFWVGS
jgi:hypothetical protein